MRKVFMVVIWSASLAIPAVAQECQCRPYPFRPEPPCFKICVEIITQRADLDELQEVFRLSEETTAAISLARQNASTEISKELIDTVSAEIRSADEEQVQEFLEREENIFSDFSSKFEAGGNSRFDDTMRDEDADSFVEPEQQLLLEEQLGGQGFE